MVKNMSYNFQKYLSDYVIFRQTSCAYIFQQNNLAKRKNMHLLRVARSLVFAYHVPNSFWGEATLIVAYLINHFLSKSLKIQTPITC